MANIIRSASRRDVLKIGGLAAAGSMLGAGQGRAAPNLSFMHESSFIQTYDDFFKKTLVPEYQKATGIAVDYQLISVGSLQTRMATAAETGSGPDMTLDLFQLAVFVRRQAGRCQRHRRGDRQEERRLVRLRPRKR